VSGRSRATAPEVRAGFRTRGQLPAVHALGSMLGGGMPHALLLVGPPGVGKATLADDVAAGLVCIAPDPADRPCRVCRACRAFEHGNHPDVHRLAPTGAGNVIPIGGREERGVRDLVRDLALLPVEGGPRVALVTAADRMTEDAQSAFLKTLEEPPIGAILILTASDEERLLPTIRSRCVRIRLGPVARRDVEDLLVDAELAEAPLAARLARISGGRPGDAVALARSPASLVIRSEVGRTLLDLLSATRADRLRIGRDLLARGAELLAALRPAPGPGEARPTGRGRKAAKAVQAESAHVEAAPAEADVAGPAARVPAAERRAAAIALAAIWRDVARDLALVSLGESGDVRQIDLLDDLENVARTLPAGFPQAQLRRLDVAGERLEGNVSPELVVDELVLGWVA
jgi:DNA polymerase III delta' subunit